MNHLRVSTVGYRITVLKLRYITVMEYYHITSKQLEATKCCVSNRSKRERCLVIFIGGTLAKDILQGLGYGIIAVAVLY